MQAPQAPKRICGFRAPPHSPTSAQYKAHGTSVTTVRVLWREEVNMLATELRRAPLACQPQPNTKRFYYYCGRALARGGDADGVESKS